MSAFAFGENMAANFGDEKAANDMLAQLAAGSKTAPYSLAKQPSAQKFNGLSGFMNFANKNLVQPMMNIGRQSGQAVNQTMNPRQPSSPFHGLVPQKQVPQPLQKAGAREFGAKVASLADNPMAIGAGAGGVLGAGVGALGGGLYGAINPGYDEEGKRKSRLMAALKGLAVGGLGGGAIGAGVGAMGGRAAEMSFGLGRDVERDISGLDRDLHNARAQLRATRELHGLDAPSNAVDPASKARLAQIGAMA